MLKFDNFMLKFDNILKSYPLQTFVQTFEINTQLILGLHTVFMYANKILLAKQNSPL